MGKFIDITGERFGSLVVLKRSDDRGDNRVRFDCICDCGNTCSVISYRLRSGGTKSCGCKREAYYRSIKYDLTGLRCNMLTVIRRVEPDKKGNSKWECICECGARTISYGRDLKKLKIKSCGCQGRKAVSKAATTHGMTKTRTWRIWEGMRRRCNNKNNDNYDYYGGRGIKYCERWEKFENFYEDMGERPYGMTLDRIDADGDYEPSNCRWCSPKDQANNRRNNHYITYKGETKTLTEWSRIVGITTRGLTMRINKWGLEKAMTTPVAKRKWEKPNNA